MPDNIFAGNVFEKFNGDVLDVRLETAVLRHGKYTGQDRDGNPCEYVNVSVKKSRQGNWYVVLDTYRKDNPGGQLSAPRPQQPAAPPQAAPRPPPRPPAPPAQPPPFPAQPPAEAQPPWPQGAQPPGPNPGEPQHQGPDLSDPKSDVPFDENIS